MLSTGDRLNAHRSFAEFIEAGSAGELEPERVVEHLPSERFGRFAFRSQQE